MPDDDRADQLRMARQRLHVLRAVVSALDRRDESSAVISASTDVATAADALAELLGTDEVGAHAVLALHWSSFTAVRSRQAREDLSEIVGVVSALEESTCEP